MDSTDRKFAVRSVFKRQQRKISATESRRRDWWQNRQVLNSVHYICVLHSRFWHRSPSCCFQVLVWQLKSLRRQ